MHSNWSIKQRVKLIRHHPQKLFKQSLGGSIARRRSRVLRSGRGGGDSSFRRGRTECSPSLPASPRPFPLNAARPPPQPAPHTMAPGAGSRHRVLAPPARPPRGPRSRVRAQRRRVGSFAPRAATRCRRQRPRARASPRILGRGEGKVGRGASHRPGLPQPRLPPPGFPPPRACPPGVGGARAGGHSLSR